MVERCPRCGYSLAGLPGGASARCPECGTAVDAGSVRAEHWEAVVHGFRWLGFAASPFLAVPAALLLSTATGGVEDGVRGEYLVSWFGMAFAFAFTALRRRWRHRGMARPGWHAVLAAAVAAAAYTGVGVVLTVS